MGNLCSTDDTAGSKSTSKKSGGRKGEGPGGKLKMSFERTVAHSMAKDKQTFEMSRDPADFRAEALRDTKFVRLPGQINDQRINIEDCANTNFFLIDEADSIQIDDCVNCKFFIAPTMSSVFVRGCKDCTFVVACGQLRTRDIKRCQFSLYCQSRPVIESSTAVSIGCFYTPGYFQLPEHFAKARLSVFANRYTVVHDFTPKDGNYNLIPASVVRSAEFFPPLSEGEGYVTEEETEMMKENVVVPYTHGMQRHDLPRVKIIIFRPGCVEEAIGLCQALEEGFSAAIAANPSKDGMDAESVLLHTDEHRFSDQSFATLGARAKLTEKQKSAMLDQPCVTLAIATRAASAETSKAWTTWAGRTGADAAQHAVLYEQEGAAAGMEELVEDMFAKLPVQGKGFGSAL